MTGETVSSDPVLSPPPISAPLINDDESTSGTKEPVGRHASLAYWIMILLGAGLLLPYSIALNALDYFNHNFPDASIPFYMPFCYIAPQIPTVIIMLKWGTNWSYTRTIVSMFAANAVSLVFMVIMGRYSAVGSLMAIGLMGTFTGILQTSMFGFAGQFPPMYSQAVMAGQGVAGVSAGIARIITKAAWVGHIDASAYFYFAVACASMLLCIVAYLYMVRLPFVETTMKRGEELARTPRTPRRAGRTPKTPASSSSRGSEEHHEPLLADPPGPPGLNRSYTLKKFLEKPEKLTVVELRDASHSLVDLEATDVDDEECEIEMAENPFDLFRKIWACCVGEFLIFTMTFSIFPGEIASIKYHETIHASGLDFLKYSGWWTVILITFFNIMDLAGRTIAGKAQVLNELGVFIVSIIRFGFVPIAVCAVHVCSPIFDDYLSVVFMGFFSISNGYTASVGMMYTDRNVHPADLQTAGMMLSFAMMIGILTGSMVAFGVRQL